MIPSAAPAKFYVRRVVPRTENSSGVSAKRHTLIHSSYAHGLKLAGFLQGLTGCTGYFFVIFILSILCILVIQAVS